MFRKWFGRGGANAPSDADSLAAIRRDFHALLIRPSDRDLKRALESWRWTGVPEGPPLLVSAFGDVFLRGPQSVLMLDTLEGALRPVARDANELRQRLSAVDSQDELLSSVWVQAAERRGLKLAPGECFDWSIAPALGGPISAEAITTMSFVVKVNIAGQLHEQLKGLPPGTRIGKVAISD